MNAAAPIVTNSATRLRAVDRTIVWTSLISSGTPRLTGVSTWILMGIRPVSKLEHVSAGLNRGFPKVCGFGSLMALIRDEGAIDAETMFSGFARARAGSGGSGSVAARGGGIL